MAHSPEEQSLLYHIWHELHEKSGQSAAAAQLARQVRQGLDNKQSIFSLELAAMELSTRHAAILRTFSAEVVIQQLIRCIELAQDVLPIGENHDEALRKSEPWDAVFGSRNAQLELLRTFTHCIQTLDLLVNAVELKSYSLSLLQLIETLSQELSNDGALQMAVIEMSNYQTAQQTFNRFLDNNQEKGDVSRIITISMRMAERALIQKDRKTALFAIVQGTTALTGDFRKAFHFLRQFFLTLRKSRNSKNSLKQRLSANISESLSIEDASKLLSVTRFIFVGIGNGIVRKL